MAAQGSKSAPGTFAIGLVLSGGVSAGSYAAGVLDYFTKALDDYERQRGTGAKDGPRHRPLIRAISGSSSGGITAASLVGGFAGERPFGQMLHDDWVGRIDIDELLNTKDLEAENIPVRSLLDSTIIEDRLKEALSAPPRERKPGFISDPLDIFITVSNLRGVRFPVFGNRESGKYEMSLHHDHLHFRLHDGNCHTHDHICLFVDGTRCRDLGWCKLYQAALATAAFPLAFPARSLARDPEDYKHRFDDPFPPSNLQLNEEQEKKKKETYEFVAVDGGMLKNNPVELARRVTKGDGPAEGADPDSATWAVVLVDPLPYVSDQELGVFRPGEGLFEVGVGVIDALKWEVQFDEGEIRRAYDKQVCDTFLISPSGPDGVSPVIFSAKLGAFAGFLNRAYRDHDYALGRRNCQRFLRKYFTLGPKNPLFGQWNGNYLGGMCLTQENGEDRLPIIPVDPAEPEIPLPARPHVSDWTFLNKLLDRRMRPLGRRIIDEQLTGVPWLLSRVAWRMILRRHLRKRLLRLIRSELDLLR